MERKIKSQKLLQTWESVRQKITSIDQSIACKVETELAEKDVMVSGKGTDLLETIDVLHESLQTKSADILPKVFNAYLAFCLAVLKHEHTRDSKLTEILKECQLQILNINLPLTKNITKMRDMVTCSKKCTTALWKSADQMKPSEQNRHLLLADQINVSLGLLMKAVAQFEMDEKKACKNHQTAIEYVLGRLLWCVKDTGGEDPGECGQFLQIMDEVLDLLEGNSDKKPIDIDKLKDTCQTLLSHALSVAHVSLDQDSQDIFYISQKVLSRVESLHNEGNSNLVSLQLGALADNLLQLEQTVNNALLKLVLEVFSDVDASLAKLVDADKSEDFDKCISDFDLYVDRIMQIGLFAIACSSNIKRVSGVRSCLASIESLEPEFVPSIQALRSGKGESELVKFYKDHWKDEIERLETLLDQLIDPAAFSQIVANKVMALQSSATSAPKLVLCASKLRSLISHLDSVELDLSSELIKKFDYYLAELKGALDQPPSEKWERRVLERARLLSKSIQVIAQELVDHSETVESFRSTTPAKSSNTIPTEDESIPEEEPQAQRSPHSLFKFPDSVRDLPVDITETLKGTNIEPFFIAGKKLNRERNVLYKTPQQAKTPLSILRKTPGNIILHDPTTPNTVAKELFPQENAQEEVSEKLETSMGLNVTNILENLSGTDDTLSLLVGIEESMGTALECFKRRRFKIGASARSRKFSIGNGYIPAQHTTVATTFSPSIGSEGISVGEREKDLSFLQKKIEDLKTDLEEFGKTVLSSQNGDF
ncbi:uncharacterized protein LOC132205430 [Neocloeon triangulifer]|uniref:uncharacterized protein LOC132205430 n=1 Tax=Neocloeon triangulifer TaxID=2078957 RepID=UPI00286F058E|nr:uncharacterized protein LOC132205430 [Neocloeon triangulifer]